MFREIVKGTGYPLHPPVSPSFPLPRVNRVPSDFKWRLTKKFVELVFLLGYAPVDVTEPQEPATSTPDTVIA